MAKRRAPASAVGLLESTDRGRSAPIMEAPLPAFPDRSMDESRDDAQAAKRILIVDDDPEIIDSIRITLEAKGFEVLVARNGNMGLAMAEKSNPDLVILDMMMPKRSGFLVLEALRKDLSNPVKVIMITANEGSRHKAYAEELGVDDYIRKPFAMDRLIDAVFRLTGAEA